VNQEIHRRKGRIIGAAPLLNDIRLACYSTGLFNGEGYSYNKRRTGGRPSPTIAITMCDEDALLPAAKWWALPVRKRGGRSKTCSDGQAYRIEASGLRASLLVEKMKESGLSSRKRQQWQKVLSQSEQKAIAAPR
jgi:hypothetical protein